MNEIQNVFSKYRMTAMQDSLERKLNSTAVVDDIVLLCKTGKTHSSNNFGQIVQTNISAVSSTNFSVRTHHWTDRINMYNCDFF